MKSQFLLFLFASLMAFAPTEARAEYYSGYGGGVAMHETIIVRQQFGYRMPGYGYGYGGGYGCGYGYGGYCRPMIFRGCFRRRFRRCCWNRRRCFGGGFALGISVGNFSLGIARF